jgi:hypothetical protein
MARPAVNTSSRLLAVLLGALAGWFQAHRETLRLEFADDDPTLDAQNLAEDLLRAEDLLANERKEDKLMTSERDNATHHALRLYRSIRAAVERRTQHPALLDDFHFQNVQPLRNPQAMSRAIEHVLRALNLHHDTFNTHPSFTRWTEELSLAHAKLNQLLADSARESMETQHAARQRDELRQRALDLIDNVYSAAQAVEFHDAEPLRSLKDLIRAYTRFA